MSLFLAAKSHHDTSAYIIICNKINMTAGTFLQQESPTDIQLPSKAPNYAPDYAFQPIGRHRPALRRNKYNEISRNLI